MSEFDPHAVKTFKAKKCKCGFVNTYTNVRCEACGESLKHVRIIVVKVRDK